MGEKGSNLTRRTFMVAGSTAIAAPLIRNMAGMVPEAGAAEKNYDLVDRKNCDLVVLGGGGSGLTAAVRAAQLTGKKVIVLETVKEYNENCKAGDDIGCYKEKKYLVPISKPPYYATREGVGTDGALGGVRVNPEMQAYKADRTSLVEGLYVTGDFATGRHINLGGIKRQVLNDLAWAFSSGFLAGTNVAGFLKKLG